MHVRYRLGEVENLAKNFRSQLKEGAILTKHSLSELGIIGTNTHRVDSYFLHLAYLTKPFYIVQLTLSPDYPEGKSTVLI